MSPAENVAAVIVLAAGAASLPTWLVARLLRPRCPSRRVFVLTLITSISVGGGLVSWWLWEFTSATVPHAQDHRSLLERRLDRLGEYWFDSPAGVITASAALAIALVAYKATDNGPPAN